MSDADKIAETKGPERIWAHGNCMGLLGRPLRPGPSRHWATWETRAGDPNHSTEYIRADIADAQAQRIAALEQAARWAVEIIIDSWGKDQIEAGDDQACNVLRAALGDTP